MLALSAILHGQQPPTDPIPFQDQALRLAAARVRKPPEALSLTSAVEARFPITKRRLSSFKFLDPGSGEVLGLALDENGEAVDAQAFVEQEETSRRAIYGSLDPGLAEALGAAPADRVFDVAIWIQEPQREEVLQAEPDTLERVLTTDEVSDAYIEELNSRRRAEILPIMSPVAERLDASGVGFVADEYAPVFFATASADLLREIATWREVDRIYLEVENEPMLDIARLAVNANVPHSAGITGTNERVAQIEARGGRVSASNPNLAGVVRNLTFACSNTDLHSTAVAGIIRSRHAVDRGIAPGATLWAGGSCSGSSTQLFSLSNMAVDWGARSLNLSWGCINCSLTPGLMDRFYDALALNRRVTVVSAAGNYGSSTGVVTSPSLAYNTIAVGNFNDRNTDTWSDDVMNPTSSWRDPTSAFGDREKPEVAAPGTAFNSTTTTSPWVGSVGSGTSFAAPVVTGISALIMDRNTSLRTWPEAVKAIILASARNNIEGHSRLSEYDGAGGVDAQRADAIVRRSLGNWNAQNYGCSSPVDLDIATMTLVAGKRTRVAIAWDNDPAYSGYTLQPGTDLDLHILVGNVGVVAYSTSLDNSYEIVDFTPPVSGTYTIRIHKFRCSSSPQRMAWAWFRYS